MQLLVQAGYKGLSGPFSFAFAAGFLLLVLAPLVRGGNRHVALIGLEWLGLLVLWFCIAQPLLAGRSASVLPVATAPAPLSGAEWLLALAPFWLALVYLTPFPVALWGGLPGRQVYLSALGEGWRPLSLVPDATVASLLAGIPLVAALVFARTASLAHFHLLPKVVVFSALAQAVWGLLQAGPFKALYFGAAFSGSPIGSFANSNHFANYLAMSLPLAVFLLWQSLPGAYGGRRTHQPAATLLWSVVLFVLLAGVLASGSRTGTATALLVTLLAASVLLLPTSERFKRGHLLGAGVLLLAVIVTVGLNAFVSRLGADALGAHAAFRWQHISSTWRAAVALWPAGSGPGSFAAVYPQFQPPGLRGFLEHAHNDYVQLFMELGAASFALGALLAGLVIRQSLWLWHTSRSGTRSATRSRTFQLQVCCALGVLAIGLHSLLDFNFRIPANAILAACLLGGFLRR